LFAAATTAAALWAHSLMLAAVFGVLGLFIVAIVSATQADIAAVFVVAAVLGITPFQAVVPAALEPWHHSRAGGNDDAKVAKRVLVALGDSYLSGEGASVYYNGTDEAGGDQCRRSPTAWAALAGQLKPFTGLAFLACSGAGTDNVNSSGPMKTQTGEPGTQLNQYQTNQNPKSGHPITPWLVVVTVGGNDAGFGSIGQMCLAPGSCADRWPSHLRLNNLSAVQNALARTYDQIGRTFPRTPVLVVGYPNPIADTPGPDHKCGQLTFTYAERKFVTKFVTKLDRTMQTAARNRPNLYYLDQSLTVLKDAHLQLCDPANNGQPGLNFIGLRSMRGTSEQRFNPQNWIHNSLHPNERGHLAILRAFEGWIAAHPHAKSRAVNYYKHHGKPKDLAPARQAAIIVKPPCDIVSTSTNTCTRAGQTWALRQLGNAVMPAVLTLGLLAVGGAWAAGAALFGWRRQLAVKFDAAGASATTGTPTRPLGRPTAAGGPEPEEQPPGRTDGTPPREQ
jgi:lysophospholipase L1-like esterase